MQTLILPLFCSDGFEQVLCETSNCIGVAGDLLKFYNFSS